MRTRIRLLAALSVVLVGLVVAPQAASAAQGAVPSVKEKQALAQRDSASTAVHAQAAPGVEASPGIEEAWPDSYRYANCGSYANYVHLSDYVRAGITSGSISGNSLVWWLGPGNASSIHLKDSYSVSGAFTYWNSPGSKWYVIGDTLSYEQTTGNNTWQNNHQYSITYTGFLAYYSHSTYGDVQAAGLYCSISTSASAWF